ncbi:hypothetical protein PAMA_020946 [Pampus argenteus]
MQQWNLSELQGVSPTQQGASTQRTDHDGASVRATSLSSRARRGTSCPLRGAPLWSWLLLGALVVPGAWSFLNEEQEELLVELHNHYRGQVSPSASAMLPLRWDSSLKVIAEGYAAKCIWNHNPELEETGENLYANTATLDLRGALEKWFLEHLYYDYQNNSCDEEKMCGHYTQMVWADTHRVGCALHLCNSMEGLEWERVYFLVCNYYPAGNYEGERPYVEGDWCSRCPENLQNCENNLCVADKVEEEDEEEDEDKDEEMTVHPQEEEEVVVVEEEMVGMEEMAEEKEVAMEERNVVPPSPTTTDFFLQPVTTSSLPDSPQPTSPAPGTHHPKVPSAKQEETKKDEQVVDELKEKEATDKEEGAMEKDVVTKRNRYIQSAASVASVSSPSLLLACLTGMLALGL